MVFLGGQREKSSVAYLGTAGTGKSKPCVLTVCVLALCPEQGGPLCLAFSGAQAQTERTLFNFSYADPETHRC